MSDFGLLFRKIRKERKVTLRHVAENIGKSISYLSDIERGRKDPPELNIVEKIEQLFGITDGRLVSLARRVRSQRPAELARRIQNRQRLQEALFRLDELSDEEIDRVIANMDGERGQTDAS